MENKSLPIWRQQLEGGYTKFMLLNPEKAKNELGFAMQIFQNNPSLQKCNPQSIMDSVVNVARTSITLNPVMKLAYLIPRKGRCVLEFSYMGLVKMLKDNGCITTISAHIVYADEEFEYLVGENLIIHTPKYAETEDEHNARKVKGCYSRATLPSGDVVFEFMPMWEIDKVKRMSEGSSNKYSAWQTWKDEMIKKSVIKRHFKMLISGNTSEELQQALKIEQENNTLVNNVGSATLSVKDGFSDFSEEKAQPTPSLFDTSSTPPKNENSERFTKLSEDDIEDILDLEARKHLQSDEKRKEEYFAETKEEFLDALKSSDTPTTTKGGTQMSI